MNSWLPIETAPRDGTEILAISEDGVIRVCSAKMFWKDRWEVFRDDKHSPGHTWSIIPTHWMPLPAPPTQDSAGG
jgi:hypothetical protein